MAVTEVPEEPQGLAQVLIAERAAFDEEMERKGLGADFVAFSMTDKASASYLLASVPLFVIPVDYSEVVLEAGLGSESLVTAVEQTIEPLRKTGRTLLLGAALSILEAGLRHHVSIEERLEMALEAARCFPAERVPRLLGRSLLNVGTILRDSGASYDALIAYDKAEPLLRQTGDDVGLVAMRYHRGVVMRSASLYEEGLLNLEAASAQGDADRSLVDGITSERIISTFESGDVAAASDQVDEWVAKLSGDKETTSFNRVMPHALRARIKLRTGEMDASLDELAIAMQLAAKAIREHATRGFRTSDRAQLQPVFEDALRMALGNGRVDLAIAALLSEKSVVPGRVRLASARAAGSLTESALDDLAAETAELARKATGACVSRDLEGMRRFSEHSGDLLDRADVLTGHTVADDVFNIPRMAERVREGLQPGELVMEYLFVAGTVWVVAIRAEGMDAHPVLLLASDALILAASVAAERTARDRSRALNRLGGALLKPVMDLVSQAQRLYIILPPELPILPLHAVEIEGAPLIAQVEVAYLPSVEFLDPRLPKAEASGAAQAMAVPEPRYEVLPPLTSAVAEASMVAAHLGGFTPLLEDQATASALLGALTKPGVLHIASHAAFEPEAPLLARVLMADRPVFAFEIALARSAVSAVNLSGCSTGLQLTKVGGEADGLAAVLVAAGVPAVVACWWPVQDKVAAAFNDAFYAHLNGPGGRQDVWAATNAAQRSLFQNREWRHPASWAPFVVVGSPARGQA
jgi:hypothetical protein